MAADNKRPYAGFGGGLLALWNMLKKPEQDTVNGLLKKQEEKELRNRLDFDGISEKIEDIQLNKNLLESGRNLEMYDDSPDTQDMKDIRYSIDEPADDAREDRIQREDQWIQKLVDKEAEDYDTKMDDARETYLSNQHSPKSGGMTDNAFGSKKSGMSPVQQQAMVGLLKDFMSKAPDDPAPQVRGAGIIKGSGTPFPSLLAKKPERPRYVNKGLL